VTHNTEHVFGLCLPSALPVTLAPGEHVQYRWLPRDAATEACFSPSTQQRFACYPTYNQCMSVSLHIASYNMHKGLSQFNRRLTVHELRDRLGTLGTDIVFLQEVQGGHSKGASRFLHWPKEPQHEFLAGHVYTDFAYGKNCIYDTGHHGNAILSRHKILSWEKRRHLGALIREPRHAALRD